MKIGFIGLGIMGRPMSKNLLKAGHDLTVFDLSKEAVDDVVAAGARPAQNIADAVSDRDMIITMLPDSPQVRDVLLGTGGVVAAARKGSLIVDMSSIAPVTSRECEAASRTAGVRMIDAPVSGGEPKAVEGTLSIMCGGEPADFDEARPALLKMGASAILCGPIGSGNITKLCNQIIVGVNIAGMCEALTLAAKAGVDPEVVFKAIRGGLAGSTVLDAKAPKVLNRDFQPGFKIDLHIKDLKNALDTAHSVGSPVMFTEEVLKIMKELSAAGDGQSDHCAMIKYYEQNSRTAPELKSTFAEFKGKIMTVTGLLPAEDIGIMFCHEHLYTKHQGPDIDLDDIELAIEEVKQFKELGGTTIVEQSNNRIGRNPSALLRIAKETGLNILMGSGYYKDAWIPESFNALSVDDIAQEIYDDIVVGIDVDGVRVHAGHIGEIGVSRCITAREERSLRGSARAQKATGAAMTIHFDLDAKEADHEHVIQILQDESVDLHRVVICHIIPRLENIDRIIRLARQGINISFETFGIEIDQRMLKLIDTTMEEQVVSIKEMIRRGLIDHLMISQDVGFKSCLTVNGGYGYAHILKNIVPWFRKLKVNEYDIERMIWHTPRKTFTLHGRFPSY